MTTFLCCMRCTRGYSGTVAGFSTVSVGRDGYTAFQRYKGRIYNGEVCDLFECVLFKVPSPEDAKLDDRFRLGVWIGKTSRGDDHLIFDGDEVWKCRTVKRRPEYLRWERVRVDAIDAHPQRPRPPRKRIPVIVRSDTLHGATSRSMAGHPYARLVRLTGPGTRRSVESVLRRYSRRRTRRKY